MKSLFLYTLLILLILSSCKKLITDISLDDLIDMEEYTGGLSVNSESYKDNPIEKILINGIKSDDVDNLSLSESGYYHIEIYYFLSNNLISETIRIVILDEERGEAEWGLKKWTPKALVLNNNWDEPVTLIHPHIVPSGINIPLVTILSNELNTSSANVIATVGSLDFNIKRGVGSCQISPDNQENLNLTIHPFNFAINCETITYDPLILSGTLSGDMHIPENSFMKIDADLLIPKDITLTINAGSIIIIDPEVNIYNNGFISISGSQTNPVTITCSMPDKYWGGFISTGSGNKIDAISTIFCQSGYHSKGIYNYGHAHRQALFYSENGSLTIEHCYMIDHAGQIFYPIASTVDIQNSLVQRAKTGGQINQSQITIFNSIFSDFPNDTYEYQDEDNDCLYLMGSDAIISHSTFMFAKDDGLDSGGSEGGVIDVVNCWFEAIFHEGAALSSGGSATKMHKFKGCTFTNCGQGLELGYSSPDHLATIDSCLFYENGIGIRYGDNYTTQHKGNISVSNSFSIHNLERDIWNMNREYWAADTSSMRFDNVSVSMENPMYPQLKLY